MNRMRVDQVRVESITGILLHSVLIEQTFTRLATSTFGCEAVRVASNDSSFDKLIENFRPDVTIFDRFVMEEQFGWRVRKSWPASLRVLDTQDLHFIRRVRQAVAEQFAPIEDSSSKSILISSSSNLHPHSIIPASILENAALHTHPTDPNLCRELASMHRSDIIWVVSSYEKHLLSSHFGLPSPKIGLAPFLYPDTLIQRQSNSKFDGCKRQFSERQHFCTIGNFMHAPNADSVLYIRSEIWPRIKEKLVYLSSSNSVSAMDLGDLSKVEFHAFGAYAGPAHLKLDDPISGFRVIGSVVNHLRKLAQYRVHLAPLRFGAGIKGKIADSWLAGLPVVTTTIGAEGMCKSGIGHHFLSGNKQSSVAGFWCQSCKIAPSGSSQDMFGGLIASLDNPDDIAKAAVKLYVDRQLWEHSQMIGSQILKELFSKSAVGPSLIESLAQALSANEDHLASPSSSSSCWSRRDDALQHLFWSRGFNSPEAMSVYVESKHSVVK